MKKVEIYNWIIQLYAIKIANNLHGKEFNTETFYVDDDHMKGSTFNKNSKPLRNKFKFVMVEIAKKWLSIIREQREVWKLDQF